MFRKAMCLFGLMMPVLIIAFLGLLSGCGTGGLEEAPVTSDLSVSVAASPTSVSAGQTSIITATVTGDKNSGATVEFSLPVNSSGASFINSSGSSVSSITFTASGSGIATAIYQAGSTSSGTTVQDTVQAVLTNGANGAVILTRTATTTGNYAVSLVPSTTSVTAGQVSIITATVTSTSGSTAVGGVTVTFTLPVNNSGATLSPATATTDGAGNAVVIYQPGTTSPTQTVYDTVQAAVGTATSAVVITRRVSTTTTYAVSIGALPTSVTAGQVSVITATVTIGETGVGGVPVTFTLPVNGSGATLSAATATTDGAGNAVVIYQPGATSPTLSVYDAVQASVGTATSAVAITRSGSSSATTYAVSIRASTTTVTAGEVSVITATVDDGSYTPASDVTVTFTLPINGSGATLSAETATTDASGNAVVTYQPGTTDPTQTVYDTVQAAVGTATSAVVIERGGSSAYSITVYASPSYLLTNSSSAVVTAKVRDSMGAELSGVTVNFTVTGVAPFGTLSVALATTDGSGNAETIFTGNGVGPTGATSVVTASITVDGNTYTGTELITYW